MRLYCGTSGFSFKEWKGPFYPAKLPADEMLGFYAARLPTVEINNTFYRMPQPSVLDGWAAKVPKTFRFAVKAPRRISHVKQLKDCAEEAGYLFKTVATLGPKLGSVLIQLPPHARVESRPRPRAMTLRNRYVRRAPIAGSRRDRPRTPPAWISFRSCGSGSIWSCANKTTSARRCRRLYPSCALRRRPRAPKSLAAMIFPMPVPFDTRRSCAGDT
jgi:uncharacterized protein YecE (DUF72 family)